MHRILAHAVVSFITAREAMGMVELGADHATILVGCMDDLLSTSRLPTYTKKGEWQTRLRSRLDEPNVKWADWAAPAPTVSQERMAAMAKADPLGKKMNKDFEMASTDIDYLADGVLDKANEEDEVTRLRLHDALELFKGGEEESRVEIERLKGVYA
jgi:transaldolase